MTYLYLYLYLLPAIYIFVSFDTFPRRPEYMFS